MLDIPSGNCWLHRELEPAKWQYFPADLYISGPIENFRQADLNQKLPYNDTFFDCVSCFEGLEHAENYHFILREFYRVLKPGGKLMISTPNPLNIKSRIRFFRTGTFRGFPHLPQMPADGGHLHISPVNLSFLISFAEKYGFTLEDVHKIKCRPKVYRCVLHFVLLRLYYHLKFLFKDRDTRLFNERLYSLNVMLNDNIFVTFNKQ